MSKSNNIRKLDDFLEEEIQQDVKTEKGVHLRNSHIRTIPNGWKVMRLNDILTDIYYGITAKAVEKNTGLRMLRTTDIKDYRVNWDKLPYCEITGRRNHIDKYLIKKNDLIVARAGTAGVSVLVEKNFNDVIFGSYLIKIRLRDDVCPKFVHYFFQSKLYWRYITHAQAGSTLKNINSPTLKSLRLLLPPIDEQRRIVEVLSTIDEAIRLVDESIARTERLKKGLMQELLTKGIGRIEFKQTEIGKIPKEWKIAKLGELGDFQYGYTISASKENTGIKLLRITDIKEDGFINWDEAPYCHVTEEIFKRYRLNVGDVLFTRIGATTGKTCYIDIPIQSIFGSYLIRFIPKKPEINTRFLYFYTQSKKYWNQVNRLKSGRLKMGLNIAQLKLLQIPLPPLHEQEKIVKILWTIDKRLKTEKDRKRKLIRIKRALMDLLLTGKVRLMVRENV